MRTRKSIGFGFGSVFALAMVLAGFVASASGQTASLSGTVQGGLGPVVGAEVALYAAGTAYGAKATGLGTALTDSSGNFTVVYTPRAGHAVLYLVARGGNAGAGTNPAIGLMGVAGMSNAIPAAVTINELTTVAAEWALAQFIDATGQIIGAPASNATGLANAANQAQANLVDIATGAPASFWANQGATAASCTGASPPVNCDGLERLATIANILAACVERAGPCVNPQSHGGSGINTLAAAHDMATNPFGNAGLFALQSSSPPFTPTLTAFDGWEIALNFDPGLTDLSGPDAVAIDAVGNVWVTNYANSSLTELTSSGGLARNFSNSNGPKFSQPSGVAIDAAGNVWVTNSFSSSLDDGSVTELTASGLARNFNNSNTNGANFFGPQGVAIDAAGNIWVTGAYSMTELTSSGGLAGNFDPRGAYFSEALTVAIDAAGNAWVPNFGSDSVTELTSSGGLAGNFNNANTIGANFLAPNGVAIDTVGNVWVPNGGNSVTELTSSGGLVGNFAPSGANFDFPTGLAIDSAGDAWVANYGSAIGSPASSMAELTASGGLVGNFAPSGANLSGPTGIAIDAAGNVWVVNRNNNSVAEFIGAARPVLTPLVACLKQSPPHAVCLP